MSEQNEGKNDLNDRKVEVSDAARSLDLVVRLILDHRKVPVGFS